MYKHKHGVDMGTVAAAQLLSNTLYNRRFFPIYALAVIAGIDEQGTGYVAGYVSKQQLERVLGCQVLTKTCRMLLDRTFVRERVTRPMEDQHQS